MKKVLESAPHLKAITDLLDETALGSNSPIECYQEGKMITYKCKVESEIIGTAELNILENKIKKLSLKLSSIFLIVIRGKMHLMINTLID